MSFCLRTLRACLGAGTRRAARRRTRRHLLIPLVNAERAWSYAMELKQGGGDATRKRHHLVKRLAKAARWAAELAALSAKARSPMAAPHPGRRRSAGLPPPGG